MGSARSTEHEHRYQLCTDEDCERFPCRVYKEGFRNGWDAGYERGYTIGFNDGYQAGYKKGHEDGYKQGFPDGIAACPRPHR